MKTVKVATLAKACDAVNKGVWYEFGDKLACVFIDKQRLMCVRVTAHSLDAYEQFMYSLKQLNPNAQTPTNRPTWDSIERNLAGQGSFFLKDDKPVKCSLDCHMMSKINRIFTAAKTSYVPEINKNMFMACAKTYFYTIETVQSMHVMY